MYFNFIYLSLFVLYCGHQRVSATHVAIFSENNRPLPCWDRGVESHRGHGYLSVLRYVMSGSGLCDELTARPEKSYRLWCVVCYLETSWMRRSWPTGGRSRPKQTKLLKVIWNCRLLAPLILNLRTRQSCVAMCTSWLLYLRRNRSMLIIQKAVLDRASVYTNWRRKYPLLMPGMEPPSFNYQTRSHSFDYAILLLLVTT